MTQLPPADTQGANQEYAAFKEEFGEDSGYHDFLSFKLYPKVFAEFHEHLRRYGRVSALPTTAFFYGLAMNEAPGSTCIMWPGGGVLCNSFQSSECRAARAHSGSGNRAIRKASEFSARSPLTRM